MSVWLWSLIFFLPDYIGTCLFVYMLCAQWPSLGEAEAIMRLLRARAMGVRLPALGVVFTETLAEVLVPAPMITLVFRAKVHLVGELLQVRHIMCRVSALQHSRGCLVLLLALPEEVAAETGGQLGGEHLAACGLG